MSATFEDFKIDIDEIKVNAEKAGLSLSKTTNIGKAEQTETHPHQNKYEAEIEKIKKGIIFQDKVLEQLENMEKMERLLVEAEALKNKHQSQKLLNKEEKLRESVEHQNQL